MDQEKNGYTVTLILLCTYGLFKETRPSEPYVTDFLTGHQWKNLTMESVTDHIYPIWPYSCFVLSIPIFLLTDFLRYKPVIIFEGFAYVVTWALLVWADGIKWMQFMELMFGICTSTEVAYYTYIYAKVSEDKYKQVSSYTRSTLLIGRFSGCVLSQLLTSFHILDYGKLNYISLVNVTIAFVISIFLPKVDTSIYFHSTTDPFKRLWKDLKESFSNPTIIKWSIWVSLATCGYLQIGNYIQSLWLDILPSNIFFQLLIKVFCSINKISNRQKPDRHMSFPKFAQATQVITCQNHKVLFIYCISISASCLYYTTNVIL